MAQLSIKTQGVKGANSVLKTNIGYVTTFIDDNDNDRIVIDAFEGSGNTYKRRTTELIEVYKDGTLFFTGSFVELCEILQGK
jgi:hypothetical protein